MILEQARSGLPSHIGIIGGGRWARVIASAFDLIAPEQSKLSLCSPSNRFGWDKWLLARKPEPHRHITIINDLSILLKDSSIEFLVVARKARDNAPTAMAALRNDFNVLIEKPFALNTEEAQQIINLCNPTRLAFTGLVFMFAHNLKFFAKKVRALGRLNNIYISWSDPSNEIRGAETKFYDPSINVVQDVFPHVWSLIKLIDASSRIELISLKADAGGRKVKVKLNLNETFVMAEMERDSEARRRKISIIGSNGEAEIDFATEPGQAKLNGQIFDVSEKFESPLKTELAELLANDNHRASSEMFARQHCSLQNAIEAIRLTDNMLKSIRQQQVSQIVTGLLDKSNSEALEAANYAFREIFFSIIQNENHPIWPIKNAKSENFVVEVMAELADDTFSSKAHNMVRKNKHIMQILNLLQSAKH